MTLAAIILTPLVAGIAYIGTRYGLWLEGRIAAYSRDIAGQEFDA